MMVLGIQQVGATFVSVLLTLVHMGLVALPTKLLSCHPPGPGVWCIRRAIKHSVDPWAITILRRTWSTLALALHKLPILVR